MAPLTLADAVAALCRTPTRSYDDLAARSPNAPPQAAGLYAWWQSPGALPGVPGTPHPHEPVELLYVGTAPESATSRSNLRKRLTQHHRYAIGSSTFRRALTAFLWEREGWTPYRTNRPVLPADQLDALRTWQGEHLRVQWVEADAPWDIEPAVIRAMRPPLNRDHNQHHPFYAELVAARRRLHDAARAGTR
jgi:GIY-YIG catalytic domain